MTAAPAAVPVRTTKPSSSSGQDDVGAAVDLGTGSHRGAEAGARGGGTFDGHHQRGVAAGDVVGVAQRTGAHRAVLDAQRGDLAGPGAHEGETRRIDLDSLHDDLVCRRGDRGSGARSMDG